MKLRLFRLPVLFSAVALLNSCSVVNKIESSPANETRIAGKPNNFLQLKSGEMLDVKDLRLKTGIFTSPHLLADGKKFKPSEIRAYQLNGLYAICEECLQCSRKGKVAKEVLPGFAKRIVTGKLNVYSRMYFNGAEAVEELYLQLGEDGRIFPYTSTDLAGIVQHNTQILQILNEKGKSAASKLQLAAEIYNRQQIVAR